MQLISKHRRKSIYSFASTAEIIKFSISRSCLFNHIMHRETPQIAIDAVNDLHPLVDGYKIVPIWYMPGCNESESLTQVVQASRRRFETLFTSIP